MWELIRANRRKSITLFLGMGLCLMLLGYAIGAIFDPMAGGLIGLAAAVAIWLVQALVAYAYGGEILLAVSGAQEVSHEVHPQLFNVVEEMKIAANLPVMPKVYIIPDPALNAFATGIKPQHCAIAVTAGLLSRLNRDELQGVIAHEMAHIANRDVLFMTMAGIMLGSMVLISEVFLRGMFYRGGCSRRYSSGSSGKGGGAAIMLIVALVVAILAPILANLLYLAISRKREYLADASAVRFTRYPEGLASALEEIGNSHVKLASVNKVTAPIYISNPLGKRSFSALSSTHPPLAARIKILRGISQTFNLATYQKLYAQVQGKAEKLIPPSGLTETQLLPLRKGRAAGRRKMSKKKGMREVGDLMRAVNQYAFLACACGLQIKVPPDFKKQTVRCPRCRRENQIPAAGLAILAAAAGAISPPKSKTAPQTPLTYRRRGKGWESFRCSCGTLLQLSPVFKGAKIQCPTCQRQTKIHH